MHITPKQYSCSFTACFRAVIWGGNYRYSFNGMEKDDEIKGSGNSLDFGARIYDNRIGRWLSRDAREGETPYMSTYSAFLNNPIYVIDPDGNSGIASLDKQNKTITITSTIYFYGSKATPELAKSTAANIQKMWNDGKGKIMIDGVSYAVKFEVNGVYKTEAEVKSMAKTNTNAENNFVRIVDGSQMKFKSSKMDLGGNGGVFIEKELGAPKSTDAHEYGHSLGWNDPGDADNGAHDVNINNGEPGIMSPRGTPVKDEYGYDSQPSGKKTVNPSKRKVLSSDINKLDIDINELKTKGKTNVGSATNKLFKEDGTLLSNP